MPSRWVPGRFRTAAAALVLALGVLTAGAAPAQAYAEDVCVPFSGKGWGSCTSLLTPTPLSAALSGLTRLALQIAGPPGSRSTIHFDATYFLAQAAGFTPRQAYLIAAYDQTVDLTQYVHRDESGRLLPDRASCAGADPAPSCALATAALPGFDRDNFEGGGLFFHFMAPFAAPAPPSSSRLPVVPQATADTGTPPSGIDGFAPVLTDDRNETVVANTRRWALGQGTLCVAGLTEHAVTGAGSHECYQSPSRPTTTLNGRIPFSYQLGVLSDVNWTSKVGEMQISGRPGEQQVPASRIGDLVGEQNAALARIGVYLHVLQDRISHQICNTRSYVVGPRPPSSPKLALNPVANDLYQLLIAQNPGAISRQRLITDPDLVVFFDREDCDQTTHAARHDAETGVPQDDLPPEERTTIPGLVATYAELRMFAAAAVVAGPGAVPQVSPELTADDLIASLVAALEEPVPSARLTELTSAGQEHCLLPLPGYGGLDYTAWSARADTLGPHCPPGEGSSS